MDCWDFEIQGDNGEINIVNDGVTFDGSKAKFDVRANGLSVQCTGFLKVKKLQLLKFTHPINKEIKFEIRKQRGKDAALKVELDNAEFSIPKVDG